MIINKKIGFCNRAISISVLSFSFYALAMETSDNRITIYNALSSSVNVCLSSAGQEPQRFSDFIEIKSNFSIRFNLFHRDGCIIEPSIVFTPELEPDYRIRLQIKEQGPISRGANVTLSLDDRDVYPAILISSKKTDIYRHYIQPPFVIGESSSLLGDNYRSEIYQKSLSIENVNIPLIKIMCMTSCFAKMEHSSVFGSNKYILNSVSKEKSLSYPEEIKRNITSSTTVELDLEGSSAELFDTAIKLSVNGVTQKIHMFIDGNKIRSGDRLRVVYCKNSNLTYITNQYKVVLAVLLNNPYGKKLAPFFPDTIIVG